MAARVVHENLPPPGGVLSPAVLRRAIDCLTDRGESIGCISDVLERDGARGALSLQDKM